MGFRTFCSNKGCRKEQEPLLNTVTDKVVCAECGLEISTITSFAKAQMKQLGQTTATQQKKETYSVKCPACQKDARPKLVGDTLVCQGCNREIKNLSQTFANLVKQALKKA